MKKPLTAFTGINNVERPERHKPGEMTLASDVDLTSTRALRTRLGRTRLAELAGCAHSLCQQSFGLLCVAEGALVRYSTAGALEATIHPAIGHARVWYTEPLPSGLVAFSNGLINGLTDGTTWRPWGVPTPDGAAVDVVAGATPYWLTYRRLSDGLEGGAFYGPPVDPTATLRNLPQLAGYEVNVYFAPDGRTGFLAGRTTAADFTYDGSPITQPCYTAHLAPPPPGRLLTLWRGGRVLIADGSVLWATMPGRPEHLDPRRDYVQMPAPITFVHGEDSGVWVGTTKGLFWLAGRAFGELAINERLPGAVVLGSGAPADFTLLPGDARPGQTGAFCLVGGSVVAVSDDGQLQVYGADRYVSPITEAVATTRVRDGVLQYVVSPYQP